MITFAKRRLRNLTITVIVCLLIVFLTVTISESLKPAAIYTGFLLFAILLGLTALNARKKLPFLPLLKASTWLQVHIYAGLASIVVFLLHTGFHIPTGRIEIFLAVLFVIVALSGIVGLIFTRSLPSRINQFGETLVYDRIPGIVSRLVTKVEEIVSKAERETGSSAISDFYLMDLAPYFRSRPSQLILVGDPLRYQRRVFTRLNEFSRYLGEKEREFVAPLQQCITDKNNIDYQLAALWLLRAWLFVHIPFTYGLLIAAVVHAWLALAFAGAL